LPTGFVGGTYGGKVSSRRLGFGVMPTEVVFGGVGTVLGVAGVWGSGTAVAMGLGSLAPEITRFFGLGRTSTMSVLIPEALFTPGPASVFLLGCRSM